MWKVNNKGSATVETTLVMSVIITVIILVIYTAFFLHDYTITKAQLKYNLMKENDNITPICYMGNIEAINILKELNGKKLVADLVYFIPLLGNRKWKIVVNNQISDIDKIRKLKVCKDGMEILN